jgi:hypothetical protein
MMGERRTAGRVKTMGREMMMGTVKRRMAKTKTVAVSRMPLRMTPVRRMRLMVTAKVTVKTMAGD